MSTRVIAHRLSKEVGGEASTFLRDEVNPIENPFVKELTEKARKSLTRSGAVGTFKRDAAKRPHVFEKLLKDFYKTDGDSDFVSFSQASVAALKERISKKSAATGGFVVFVDYTMESGPQAGERYLLVALIRNQQATAFDENLNVIESIVLDLDHLKHGVRVRKNGLNENQDGVVTQLSGKTTGKTADYFSEFIGVAESTNSKQAAKGLKTRLEEWVDHKSLNKDQRSKLLSNVHGYWSENDGKTHGISIKGLSNSLYPEGPDEFFTFVTDENEGISGQTPAIRSSDMKSFLSFKFKGAGLTLEFERTGKENWGNKIIVTNGSVVIREAPQQLIDSLSKKSN